MGRSGTRSMMTHRSMVLLAALVGLSGLGAAEAGDLAGTVKLAGKVPPAALLHPTSDHAVCGREPRPSEALVVSPSGGVKNAVVFLGHERMERWRSPTIFQLDQRRCAFVPHTLIIPPGATVEVLNSDGILHNFHTLSRLNPSLNLAQPGFTKVLRATFEHPEFIPVKCDLHGHGFMRAWIVVASHPYYALTDDEGGFHLRDLPVGPHTVEVWHEVLGTKRVPVSIGAAGEVKLAVTFAGGEAAR